ncbi:MAG: LecA/PA-IL family lectin [Candidatus Omnitrophota bacterium]
MKRLISIIVFVALIFLNRTASAVVVMIDADLNSISPIYYQNIVPSYFANPVNTGLFLNPGDLLEISASGIWSNAPPSYNLIFGPNGNPYENIALTYPGEGYPVAALMGKIGDSNYFFVGSDYVNTIINSGILYLGFNDTDYGNNWGTINADVIISPISTPVPEPASILLFGIGGLAMAAFKRKRKK